MTSSWDADAESELSEAGPRPLTLHLGAPADRRTAPTQDLRPLRRGHLIAALCAVLLALLAALVLAQKAGVEADASATVPVSAVVAGA